jgi:hypothetical protein
MSQTKCNCHKKIKQPQPDPPKIGRRGAATPQKTGMLHPDPIVTFALALFEFKIAQIHIGSIQFDSNHTHKNGFVYFKNIVHDPHDTEGVREMWKVV